MKKARCVPTIVSAALSLAFPLHSVFSYLRKAAKFQNFPLISHGYFFHTLSKKKNTYGARVLNPFFVHRIEENRTVTRREHR